MKKKTMQLTVVSTLTFLLTFISPLLLCAVEEGGSQINPSGQQEEAGLATQPSNPLEEPGITPEGGLVKQEPEYAPGELIVKLKEGSTLEDIKDLNAQYNVTSTDKVFKDTPDPQETLNQLKDKLAKLSQEHESWYWQLDKDSQEYKGYIAKIEKEKEELTNQIQAQEALITKLEQRQKRAPEDATAPNLDNIYVLNTNAETDILAMASDYSNNPTVEYAEPNYIAKIKMVPNDPLYPQQWAHQKTQAELGWDITTGDPSVVVAIVDTGVDYSHEDLAANIWRDVNGYPGKDFTDIDTALYVDAGFQLIPGEDYQGIDDDPSDYNGHGTHCAGIAGAVGNNGIGVAGVAHNCKIMPVRAGFSISDGSSVYGYLEYDDIANGVRYASDNGADIISMSIGGSGSQIMKDALDYAYSKGLVLIAAAGNSSSEDKSYPAAYDNVMAVAATISDDSLAWYSNYGLWIDVAAPGSDILSTVPKTGTHSDPTGYKNLSGTSMACPYVAGLAGLILSRNQNLTSDEIASTIRHTAQDQVGPASQDTFGFDRFYGWGRVNVANAVSSAFNPPPDPAYFYVEPRQFQFDIPSLSYKDYNALLNIFNLGGGILNWTTLAPSWLTLNPSSGTGDSEILFSFNTNTNQTDVLRIQSNEATNSPVDIPISVQVHPTIKVLNSDIAISRLPGSQQWEPFEQTLPPAVPDGMGGAIYVLSDWVLGLHVQRVNKNGMPLWGNGVPVISTPQDEMVNGGCPGIVSNGKGGAIIVWKVGKNGDIRAQQIDSSGQPLWGPSGILVVANLYDFYYPLGIAFDGSGGAIISWVDTREVGGDFSNHVYAQRVNSNGVIKWNPKGVLLSRTGGSSIYNSVAISDDAGGAIIIWEDDAEVIYAQRISAGGNILWDPYGVQLNLWSGPTGANAVPDGKGGAIVSWFQSGNYASDIYVTHIDKNGQFLWDGEVYVAEELTALQGRFDPNWMPYQIPMVSDGQGGVILAWHDIRAGNYDIYAQRVDTNGQGLWGSSGTPVVSEEGQQVIPALIADNNGGAIFAWLDFRYNPYGHLYAQHLNANGESLWGTQGVCVEGQTGQDLFYFAYLYPFLVPLANNTFLLTWDDWRNCTNSSGCGGTGIDMLGALFKYYNTPLLDDTPPTLPVITDEGQYTTNTTQLFASWSSSDPESAITEYQYQILQDSTTGTVIKGWTSTGNSSSVTATGLALKQGKKYFFAVKARNGEGLWSDVGYSDGITVDTTPPNKPTVNDGGIYTTSASKLSASWSAYESVSGIVEYQYQILQYSITTDTVIQNWTSTGTLRSVALTGLTLENGKTYFFAVKAKNGAGLWSEIGYSDGITVDTTAPTKPQVTDEGEYTSSNTALSATWSSTDAESGIAQYQYKITLGSPTGTTIRVWTSTGTTPSVTATGLTLQEGKTYYFSVKAKNKAGLWSQVGYSDGIKVVTGALL